MPQAARMGDSDTDGDVIVTGSPTVFIGNGPCPSFAVIAPGILSIGGAPVYENTPAGQKAVAEADAAYLPPEAEHDSQPVPAPNPSEYIECSKFPKVITTNEMQIKVSKFFKLAHAQQMPCDQRGLSANKIACNWSALCLEILDHVIDAGFNILSTGKLNSGFRSVAQVNPKTGKSMGLTDHGLGCAADISTGSRTKNAEMFQWLVKSGLPFSQLIYEKPASSPNGWVHVSYNGKAQSVATRIMTTHNASTYEKSTGPNGQGLPPTPF